MQVSEFLGPVRKILTKTYFTFMLKKALGCRSECWCLCERGWRGNERFANYLGPLGVCKKISAQRSCVLPSLCRHRSILRSPDIRIVIRSAIVQDRNTGLSLLLHFCRLLSGIFVFIFFWRNLFPFASHENGFVVFRKTAMGKRKREKKLQLRVPLKKKKLISNSLSSPMRLLFPVARFLSRARTSHPAPKQGKRPRPAIRAPVN